MTDHSTARALVDHARKMREHLSNDLPNGVGNTLDALCDFIEQSLTPPEGDTVSDEVVNEWQRWKEADAREAEIKAQSLTPPEGDTVSEGVVERVARALHDDALARGETGSRRSWEEVTNEEREALRNLARAYFLPPSNPASPKRRHHETDSQ